MNSPAFKKVRFHKGKFDLTAFGFAFENLKPSAKWFKIRHWQLDQTKAEKMNWLYLITWLILEILQSIFLPQDRCLIHKFHAWKFLSFLKFWLKNNLDIWTDGHYAYGTTELCNNNRYYFVPKSNKYEFIMYIIFTWNNIRKKQFDFIDNLPLFND